MNLSLQKTHPLLDEELVTTMADYLMILRAEIAYGYAARSCGGRTVMEVGCNTGFCTGVIARTAKKVFALDVNEAALSYAKEHHAADNVEYILVDGKTFPALEPRPDVAVFFQLIEHIEDDGRFLEDVSVAIAPAGKVIFTTPNAKLRLRPGQAPWNPFHVREYAYEDLQTLLKGRFSSYEIYGVFGIPAVHAQEKARVEQTWWKRQVVDRYRERTGHFSVRAKLRKTFGIGAASEPVFDLQQAKATYGEGSFFLSRDNLPDALDFLVIAQK